MRKTHKEVSMGFTRGMFPAGTHMCLIYSNDLERKKLIAKFLKSGLTAGEKVGYFADTMTPKQIKHWLAGLGVPIPPDNRAKQFSVSVAEEIYCPKGKFDPEQMLNTLRDYYQQALAEGYNGARVSGEMSWSLKGIPGSERLLEYEAQVNDVLDTHPLTPICQYDANLFDGATILDVLKVHPMMIVRGQIVRNPHYMDPKDFLRDFVAKR